MRAMTLFLLLGTLLSPLAAEAAKASAPAVKAEEGMAGREAWGDKLPQMLTLTFWSGKDGEVKATKISTSREVFAISLEFGKGDKLGVKAAIAGRVLPRGEGSYELLLYIDVAGAESSKGALGLKVQSSVVAKKGQATAVAGNQDGQLFVRVD